jgi:hypothetical protein
MTEEISLSDEMLKALRAAVQRARPIAARVGPTHAAWDCILDAEALLAGKQTLLAGTPQDVASACLECMNNV